MTCLLCRCLIQGLIQSAFLWGYTATQLLGGALADKYGGRAVIAAGGGGASEQPHGSPAERHSGTCLLVGVQLLHLRV